MSNNCLEQITIVRCQAAKPSGGPSWTLQEGMGVRPLLKFSKLEINPRGLGLRVFWLVFGQIHARVKDICLFRL